MIDVTDLAVDFFNRINLMYGTIADVCTEESCPTMSGGPKYIHLVDKRQLND